MRRYLLWLNWPVECFRLNARSRAAFERAVAPFGPHATVAVASERAFLRELPRATHVLAWDFRAEWFARAPRLRVLATPSAGREWMPRAEEVPPGVVKLHGEFHGGIMAETVLACVFAQARGLYAADAFQREGFLWARAEMSPFCTRVAGTKAVVLGYGRVGRAVGALLEATGVSVKGIRRANFAELLPSLKDADWLVLALPSDTGTDGLVGARVLRALPRRATLINVGRGNAVDEAALAAALRSRRLAAAYLDVFAREPLEVTSPLADGGIPGLHRIPHASAFAPEYLPAFFAEFAEKIGKLEREERT